MRHLDELTGLRSIAVCMVILDHASSFLPSWAAGALSPAVVFGHGELGVHVFFVLSGFLITRLLVREYGQNGYINFLDFYRRRVLRILPAFYIFLTVMGGLAATDILNISWQQVLVAASFLWNYAHLLGIDHAYQSYTDGMWYLGHTWSLALEEQFYWIWPVVLWLAIRYNKTSWLPLIILAVPLLNIASYFLFPSMRRQEEIMFHTACDYLLMGCFVGLNQDRLLARWRVFGNPLFFSGLILGLLMLPNVTAKFGGYWSLTYGRTVEACMIGSLFLCMLAQPHHWFCRMLRLSPFLFIGTISYSLYLWQQVFSYVASPVFLGFPLNVAASILVASMSYQWIERPFLRRKDRHKAVVNVVPLA